MDWTTFYLVLFGFATYLLAVLAILRYFNRRNLRQQWSDYAVVHEIGHALIGYFCCRRIWVVSSIGRNNRRHCWECRTDVAKDRPAAITLAEAWAVSAMYLGGMAAEALVTGRFNNLPGCANDLTHALAGVKRLIADGDWESRILWSQLPSVLPAPPDWSLIEPKLELTTDQEKALAFAYHLAIIFICRHSEPFKRALALTKTRDGLQKVVLNRADLEECFGPPA